MFNVLLLFFLHLFIQMRNFKSLYSSCSWIFISLHNLQVSLQRRNLQFQFHSELSASSTPVKIWSILIQSASGCYSSACGISVLKPEHHPVFSYTFQWLLSLWTPLLRRRFYLSVDGHMCNNYTMTTVFLHSPFNIAIIITDCRSHWSLNNNWHEPANRKNNKSRPHATHDGVPSYIFMGTLYLLMMLWWDILCYRSPEWCFYFRIPKTRLKSVQK